MCKVFVEKNVEKDLGKKKYAYTINVFHCGTCKRHWESMNWVLIPKIEDDFGVDFVVNYKYVK